MDTTETRGAQGLEEVIQVRVTPDMRRRFRAHARAEHRSESSQARLLIERYLHERDTA